MLRPSTVCAVLVVFAPTLEAAVLAGSVVENATSRPLARCQVALSMAQSGYDVPLKTTLTDSAGRFRFTELTGGTYFLTVERGGYAAARYGEKHWNGAGTPIVLGADSEFFSEFRLRRLGAVSGQVLDENRVGLAGSTVVAYEAVGSPPLRLAGSAVSDDRGVYRIAGLAPGAYYLRTGPRELEDQRSLLPTFFGEGPGAPEPVSAPVELDQERSGIDIQPRAGRLGHLAGKVTGGRVAGVWLFSETGTKQATCDGSGQFVFAELAPGGYELLARSSSGSLAAYQRLQVGEGVNQVVLAAGAMPLVRVRVEESEGKELDPRRVTVSLTRKGLSQRLAVPQISSLVGGGAAEVMPGEYAASATAAREYYVQSLRATGTPRVANEFLALPQQTVDLVVTVSSRPASLRGTVKTLDGQPAGGAPVFLNPVDAELRSRMGGPRSVRADANGAYQFPGLPPGQYLVFSSFEFQAPQEADWQRVPVRTATIQEGQESSLELELYGAL